MNHQRGLDRSQTLLFPERLEDYIAAENTVRFLDAFVASLDLHTLSFAKARCADTGRPPYDPAALLKLYLYGYLHRIRSSRLLEAECWRNVEVIYYGSVLDIVNYSLFGLLKELKCINIKN